MSSHYPLEARDPSWLPALHDMGTWAISFPDLPSSPVPGPTILALLVLSTIVCLPPLCALSQLSGASHRGLHNRITEREASVFNDWTGVKDVGFLFWGFDARPPGPAGRF